MRSIAALLALTLLAGVGVWAYLFGPCELYTYARASEIPGRCLMEGR